MKLSIATKMMSLAVLLVLLTAFTLGWLSVGENKGIVLDLEMEKLANDTSTQAIVLQSKIDELRQDTWYLASSPPVRSLMRAMADGNSDRQTGNTIAQAQNALQSWFLGVMRDKPHYVQMRYLNKSGMEIVRVERERCHKPLKTILGRQLQPKGEKEYFKKTKALPPGALFLSELELNRERNKIHPDNPPLPVLRAAMPLHLKSDADFVGIVIINMDFSALMSDLGKHAAE